MAKNPTSDLIKSSWDYYHSVDELEMVYPEPVLISFLNYVFSSDDSISLMLDLGCGSGQTYSFSEKKLKRILGVDYSPNALKRCSNKSNIFKGFNIDLSNLEEYKKLFEDNINKNSLITAVQILDHIPKLNAMTLLKNIVKSDSKYVIISLFTNDCLGKNIKGDFNIENDTYSSPISKSRSDLFEIHSFYSDDEVKRILNLFNEEEFELVKCTRLTTNYIDPKIFNIKEKYYKDIMDAFYFLFKRN